MPGTDSSDRRCSGPTSEQERTARGRADSPRRSAPGPRRARRRGGRARTRAGSPQTATRGVRPEAPLAADVRHHGGVGLRARGRRAGRRGQERRRSAAVPPAKTSGQPGAAKAAAAARAAARATALPEDDQGDLAPAHAGSQSVGTRRQPAAAGASAMTAQSDERRPRPARDRRGSTARRRCAPTTSDAAGQQRQEVVVDLAAREAERHGHERHPEQQERTLAARHAPGRSGKSSDQGRPAAR